MPFLQLFFWAIPIIGFVSCLLLLIIFLISKRDKPMQYYAYLLFSLAIWFGSALLMRLNLPPGNLFWNRFSLCGMLVSPLCAYYFMDYYTGGSTRIIKMFWNAATAFLLLINCSGLITNEAQIIRYNNSFGKMSYSYIYTLGPMAVPAFCISVVFAVFIIYKAYYFRMQQGINSAPIYYFLIAIVISYTGVFCSINPAIGQYPIDIFCCNLGAFIICFAISKNRMTEIRFMVAKGFIFSLFLLLIISIYGTVVFLFHQHFSLSEKPTYVLISLAAFIVAALFQPSFILSRILVDRLFYKTSFKGRKVLRSFSFEIENPLNLSDLSMQLLKAVEQGVSAKNSCLLLQDNETGMYPAFFSTMPMTTKDLEINVHSPIVHWLNQNGDCLDINSFHCTAQFKALCEKERQTLMQWDIQVVTPIKSRGILTGMILLTKKQNSDAYTVEDLSLLKSFAATTAAAIDNAYIYRQTKSQSTTDELTGLYNTRYLYQYLPSVITHKNKAPVSTVIVDIDFFRIYNDLYGHLEGDKALRKIAFLIRSCVGYSGICVRYGGEEFAIVLQNYNSADAYKIAEKIRIKVQQMIFGTGQHDRRFLSVSIGLCTYPESAPNQDELMLRTDLALFTAKHSGKNKTVIYTPKLSTKGQNGNKNNGIITSNTLITALNAHSNQKGTAYTSTLYALTAAIDTKDHFTFSHSKNVACYASTLATKLGMDPIHVSTISEAGLLHDIGKIGIPEHILTKPNSLTKEEFTIMQQHVEMAIAIVKHLPSLNYVIPAIMGHHERWDGLGYPRQLKGEQIPIAARCLAIADSFDAIISKRPYKPSHTVDFALKEIETSAGIHFDPQIAAIFIDMVRNREICVYENNSAPPIALNADAI